MRTSDRRRGSVGLSFSVPVFDRLKGGYRRLLTRTIRRPAPALTACGVLVLFSLASASRLGVGGGQ